MKIKARSACIVLFAIVLVLIGVRVTVPVAMHRATIRRMQRNGWSLSTRNLPPDWMPDWVAERTETWWESALALTGPPRNGEGVAQHLVDLQELRWLPEILTIRLSDLPDPDRHVQSIRNCRELLDLHLTFSRLTDGGVSQIRDLPKLAVLELIGTQVTDQGLGNLRGLASLKALELSSTRVTGLGFRDWPDCDIAWLRLNDTEFSDVHMQFLRRFPKLRGLELNRTLISDSGLDALASLTELEEISLNETQVTNDGAAKLAGIKSLQTISLNSTAIDDRAIGLFAERLNLITLSLADTRIWTFPRIVGAPIRA